MTPMTSQSARKSNDILPEAAEETSTHRLLSILAPADYVIAHIDRERWSRQNPPIPLRPITYVLAANGLFKIAWARHFHTTVPVATWRRPLPGLGPLIGEVSLNWGIQIPARLLDACLEHARRASWARPVETMYQFYISGHRIHVTRPAQVGAAGAVIYAADRIDPADIIMDLHTHPTFGASFSATDDRDEGGLRLYAVLGQVYDARPQINVRVGVYGDFMSVPANHVFRGLGDRYQDIHDQTL
jgi:PRTRC genetic system protein A